MLLSSARCAFLLASLLLLMLNPPAKAQQELLKLEKGDHIAIIGNTLADRLQHYGHLEATLHDRFPDHHLVVRDLGFSGDTLTERPRSENFGTPDEWLNKVKVEMGKVAAERKLPFADLLHHSQEVMKLVSIDNSPLRNLVGQKNDRFGYSYPDKPSDGTLAFFPLTINGVHITEDGSQFVAGSFDRQVLVDNQAPMTDTSKVEDVRKTVLAKNHIWHNVYPPTATAFSEAGLRCNLSMDRPTLT